MRFAEYQGERILASHSIKEAKCPYCNQKVIPKCGIIKIWHWSHKSNKECDSWSGIETKWHLNWKSHFPTNSQEVIIQKNGIKHIADVKLPFGLVIEFQNSSISPRGIMNREEFYGNMIWVLNSKTIAKNVRLNKRKEDSIFTFKWSYFPKSWFNSKKPIFIDLNHLKENYEEKLNEIKDKDDNAVFYEIGRETYWEEYADGNVYPKTNHFEYPVSYGERKEWFEEKIEIYDNILEVKKVYNNGNGWGRLISKEEFIKRVKGDGATN